jgi:pyridoxal phosphate enzyme (YggS family)
MVKENLVFCLEKLNVSAAKAGISSSQVALVAVTKGVATPLILESIDCGVTQIGESKVQEALLKFDIVNAHAKNIGVRLVWHMIGHLQTNKVKETVRMFDLIHSVDSLRLAQEIDRQAAKLGKIQDVLVEIKTSDEAAKYGFSPKDIFECLPSLGLLKNLNIKGLMTLAPEVSDSQQARPFFALLRKLRDQINETTILKCFLTTLSMGMTDDFQVAIEEGATLVRIGRGIFTERL